MESTIDITTTDDMLTTNINIDSSTNFKDMLISQAKNSDRNNPKNITIHLDKSDGSIIIGDFKLSGINKDLFMKFINL